MSLMRLEIATLYPKLAPENMTITQLAVFLACLAAQGRRWLSQHSDGIQYVEESDIASE